MSFFDNFLQKFVLLFIIVVIIVIVANVITITIIVFTITTISIAAYYKAAKLQKGKFVVWICTKSSFLSSTKCFPFAKKKGGK